MGFRALRVINQDIVHPARGFDTHGHRNMEIITYVLRGTLTHKDSLGHTSQLRHGDVQRMSAGTGIRHSEYNEDKSQELELLQIWIEPERNGIEPGYEEKNFPEKNGLTPLVSPQGEDGALKIHRDVRIYRGIFSAKENFHRPTSPLRHAWLQIIRGEMRVNGLELKKGDGIGFSELDALAFTFDTGCEFLLFDLD